MRNLNIKSDEAYDIAHFIAKRRGQSLTQAVTEALQREKRAMTAEEKIARGMAIAAEASQHWKEPWKSMDHGDLLYDENGLPK